MNDIISRAAAVDAIMNLSDCENGYSGTYDKGQIIGILEDLPSAQPERKRGKWIFEGCNGFMSFGVKVNGFRCSVCKNRISKAIIQELPKFCDNCGADMRENKKGD